MIWSFSLKHQREITTSWTRPPAKRWQAGLITGTLMRKKHFKLEDGLVKLEQQTTAACGSQRCGLVYFGNVCEARLANAQRQLVFFG